MMFKLRLKYLPLLNQEYADVRHQPVKILFLVPYPVKRSPSQRFRFEQYFGLLSDSGISYSVKPFTVDKDYQFLFSNGTPVRKVSILIKGFARRFATLLILHRFNFIFIHREAAPIGPPVFEWLTAKVFRKKIIYDFDDAIWLTDRSDESWLTKKLRARNKISAICKLSYKVSAGNRYLRDYAVKYNSQTVVNPTTIDTLKILETNRNENNEVVIGWTGSHSTLKYLKGIESVLQTLERDYSNVRFLFIADQQPDLSLNRLSFKHWKLETENEDLSEIDIGIMPLPDNEWTRGKCGFKILQYMAMSIPAVASPVGVNSQIIENEENGFVCETETEWLHALRRLVEDNSLRKKFGVSGQRLVAKNYSTSSNSSNFMALFT
jgi:glycosyltransferase involved in cell wall biosynthesis